MVKIFSPIILIFLLALTATAQAGLTSSNYAIPTSGVGVTGGSSSSPNYTGVAVVGTPASGQSSSASYTATSGTGVVVVTTSSTAPAISNLRVDGTPVINGDYVKYNGTFTTTITSEAGLNLATSSIEVDGTATTFVALSGSSTYDAAAKRLTYKLNLAGTGDHTINLHAADVNGQSATAALTVKLDTGSLKAVSVYGYPNPYNPNNGNLKIAYQLNNDGNTAIYIFNAVGELVYKREYVSGAAGGTTGYNEVTWDGRSDFGVFVGNDIYFLRVVSGGKPVGKMKIAVIK